MDDTKRKTSGWFDRRAGSYEGGFTARWRDPLQRASLEALELASEDRLLDVGCGTGWASRMAADVADSVVGVDLSPRMLTEARGLLAAVGGVTFAIADAEDLPFADGTFSAVLCTNAFHHYPHPDRAIREMTRVLLPGGRLVLGDACSDRWPARMADSFLRRFEPGHVRLYRSAELGSFVQAADVHKVEMRRISEGAMAIVRGIAEA